MGKLLKVLVVFIFLNRGPTAEAAGTKGRVVLAGPDRALVFVRLTDETARDLIGDGSDKPAPLAVGDEVFF